MLDCINKLICKLSTSHLLPLILKETREILRNKHVVFLLLVPPVIQLLIIGAALDPQVRNMSLGVVDFARSRQSRDLIATIEASGVFSVLKFFKDSRALMRQLQYGKTDVAVVVPSEFTEKIDKGEPAQVQVLIDGADAYSAGIGSSYMMRILHEYRPGAAGLSMPQPIETRINMLYNPGLLSSWFFVPGVLGATLTLTATLVASAAVLRERETGTMELLLMTPAEGWEILAAKVVPLVVFLIGDVCLAVLAARAVFGLPFRGSLLLFLVASLFYVFIGIGLGMMLGIICGRQRQAQLASFFINIPLIQLSGTVVPFDTMPQFLQRLALLDPLRYYADIARGVILKGSTWLMLWPDLLALLIFAAFILSASVMLFRRQLA